MSLYYDAVKIITTSGQDDSSLKSRVYNARDLKAKPAQIFALISEASKWNPVLKEVVENSSVLSHERKLGPALALLLVHDLLFAKKGVAAPAAHPLRVAIERHKARLQAEFTKARLRRGCATIDALRQFLQNPLPSSGQADGNGVQDSTAVPKKYAHPRWVRVNVIKTTLQQQLATTFADYENVGTLDRVMEADTLSPPPKILHIDAHVPDLIAIPSKTDLSSAPAYRQGLLILQDKASCFPAYLLDPQPDEGSIIDACAAPGNKTTHLAGIVHTWNDRRQGLRVWACEKDKGRAAVLQKMISIAGADEIVSIKAGQDFLRLDPNAHPWNELGALLLDPSCSGSGIVGRGESIVLDLPSTESKEPPRRVSKKRKRLNNKSVAVIPAKIAPIEAMEETPVEGGSAETLKARLESLSGFQTKLLLHAFKFAQARRVSYSTCSIHDEENEKVVLAALNSDIAKARGWKIMRREDQVEGMRAWKFRGAPGACGDSTISHEIAEACIRCFKNTEDGTQGFFVAAFFRTDSDRSGEKESEKEWDGFGD